MAGNCSLRTLTLLQQIYLFCLIVLHSVEPSTPSDAVNCIVYNEEFMECTWTHSEGKPNYTLHYWYYSEPETECRNYIQQDGYNIGCNFSNNEIKQFRDFNVYRNGFSDSGNESTPTQTFQLQSRVKPNAPENLKVNATINNGLSLSWEAPMPRRRCLMYRVRYQSNKDKDWQSATVTEQTRFKLASVDSEKLYTFQVQSKINLYCGTTNLWSEWSLPVHWGRNETGTECVVPPINNIIPAKSTIT
uniref:cytokine receptor common subunit gamma-like isoform X2 n=1 Tax=Pristiophorus japonicus TaxID=55135 RepID=UPI00398E6375